MLKKRVTIVQYRLLHYRVELFDQLRKSLLDDGIELRVVYGGSIGAETARRDTAELEWGVRIKQAHFNLGGTDLLWQSLPKDMTDDLLVVFMQENRLLSNYPWLFGIKGKNSKVAYWGHGVNFQSNKPNGLREKWKRGMLHRVDHWFAYTKMTADLIQQSGYPSSQITCLNNSIDTKKCRNESLSINAGELNAFREGLGISASSVLGLYCGSLYPGKKLEFLVDSMDLLRRKHTDFELLVVGDGPLREMLEEKAKTRAWLHLLGAQSGRIKAISYKSAKLILNPGSLGLHILDALCFGKPLVSTKEAQHGPEICYLENGLNGVLTDNSVETYVAAVDHLLSSQEYYESISQHAMQDGMKYSMENMVSNFREGIVAAIGGKASSS